MSYLSVPESDRKRAPRISEGTYLFPSVLEPARAPGRPPTAACPIAQSHTDPAPAIAVAVAASLTGEATDQISSDCSVIVVHQRNRLFTATLLRQFLFDGYLKARSRKKKTFVLSPGARAAYVPVPTQTLP